MIDQSSIRSTRTAPPSFALVGAAGYIAPRHMRAIAHVNGDLKAALDPSDSVGVMDSHFPQAHFFVEFERFDRHVELLRRNEEPIDYVAICSPNYLHDSHIRFALRSGADAICEKPLVLNPWNIDALIEMEKETNQRVNTILQLRLHPSVVSLKKRLEAGKKDRKAEVDLTYITSRGRWYLTSWKGDDKKAGGIASNIGVHFFDMLGHLFGDVQENIMHLRTPTTNAGYIEYEHARVRWLLSVDDSNLPEEAAAAGLRTYRSLQIDGEEFEFSDGFTELHNISYERIIKGEGFGLEENRIAIETVSALRTIDISTRGEIHPLVWKAKTGKSADEELNLVRYNSDC